MEKAKLGEGKNTVLIRDFRITDLDNLLDLLPKCFAKEFEVTGFDPAHTRDMVNRAFGKTGKLFLALSRLFGKEPIKFLVAEAKSEVVGTTIVNGRGRVGYISAVMVHPDYRRKGIATALMKSAIEYIKKRRMDRAILHTDSTNTPAISAYTKLGFKAFEHIAFLVGEIDSMSRREDTDEVKTRSFQEDDLDEVYNLIKASEDPNHLRIFDFSKRDLKTSFWQRMFRFSTQKKMVAVLDGKIVGYAGIAYTTPKEAGSIGSVHVNPKDKSRGIEKVLINAAINEIRKGGVGRIRVMAPTTKQELVETLNNMGFRETLTMDGMFKESRC